MKVLLSMAVAAMLLVGSAMAAAPAKPVVLQAKSGAVTYDHGKHKALKCETCHADAKGGKIAGLDKDKGHAMCQECHKKEGKGPQKCADCHKK
jgi:opacity protein-like surface antigen